MTEREVLERIEEAAREGSMTLDLSSKSLKSLPGKIGELTNLKVLYLEHNQLTSLPAELGQLVKLAELTLQNNRLMEVPPELGQLKNLQGLNLAHNQLTEIPAELGLLKNVTVLDLSDNRLSFLPAKIWELTKLNVLDLSANRLKSVPPEIGQLTSLVELNLGRNDLAALPAAIGSLKRLVRLGLVYNRLSSLPSEIGGLTRLTGLYVWNNQLKSLPSEIGGLANLTRLDLSGNRLFLVPAQIRELRSLTTLDLRSNRLGLLPPEIGELSNLEELFLVGNPVESPPPEVVEQGTQAILAYLREQVKATRRQWVSKLLVVGEGGVGKTSLLRALRGRDFVEGLETTHGIGVEKLELAHPTEADVTMELKTWDFGGQQIYHATHQFFLTKRSLFVLVWDARHGWEAGKLYQWLDRIKAKMPDAPVMVVAAHIDERGAELPLEDLRKKYPQFVGHYKVSNKTGAGIEEFRKEVAARAAQLPLMGEEWPARWLDAAEAIREVDKYSIKSERLYQVMARCGVTDTSADVLAQLLHDLGDILYFKDNENLNDLAILKPQWVNEAISKVLESTEVIQKDGIFTREHMDILWGDVDQNIREHLLWLMEQFDLSYRTLENREISLVVERLPLDPPDYRNRWDAIQQSEGCKEISMKFELSSIPAGMPTWFIARSHRFTTHTHWRMGGLFADGEERRHLGLVEAHPHDRFVRLTVRGPVPYNFFVLLRDGLELTLGRFPGLKIKRTIPCPGHDGPGCIHEFDFRQLEKAFQKEKMLIECPEGLEDVSVATMLFGLHGDTQDAVLKRLDELEAKLVEGHEAILTESRELKELSQRGFTSLFNAAQRLEESHCPNVFAVVPKEGKAWLKNIVGQKMVLQLYCQVPGAWHPALEGKPYEIRKPAEWLGAVGPYIMKLAKVIKYAAPVAGAAAELYVKGIGEVLGTDLAQKLPKQIKLMEELAKKIKDDKGLAAMERREGAERIEGAGLRALRRLLDEVDAEHYWGGLKKILTPEGHYLWLCEYHAQEYAN